MRRFQKDRERDYMGNAQRAFGFYWVLTNDNSWSEKSYWTIMEFIDGMEGIGWYQTQSENSMRDSDLIEINEQILLPPQK